MEIHQTVQTQLKIASYLNTKPRLALTFTFTPYFLWIEMNYDIAVDLQATFRSWIQNETILDVTYNQSTFELITVKESVFSAKITRNSKDSSCHIL